MTSTSTPQTVLTILLLLGVGIIIGAVAALVWTRSMSRTRSEVELARAESERAGAQLELADARSSVDRLEGQLAVEQRIRRSAEADLNRERVTQSELREQMRPLTNALEGLRRQQTDAERARQEAGVQLREQVTSLGEKFTAASGQVRDEARRLNQALSRSERRGSWGEMQLRRVVESAGMIDHVHFIEQDHIRVEGGTRRPDLVVDLAGGRRIVVDAKVPLDAFLQLDTDSDQEATLKAHAAAVQQHVTQLASKAYWKSYNSPEFVILFLPAEGLLSAALDARPGLLQAAFDVNVVIATPTTLVAVLRSISYAWQQSQIAERAKQIHSDAVDLHQRLRTMAGHFERLGGSLGKTVDAFNKTVSSMESRVLPAARRFGDLAEISDTVPEPASLETAVRPIRPKRWTPDDTIGGSDFDPQDQPEHSASDVDGAVSA